MKSAFERPTTALLVAAALAGCAALPPARMQLPAPLAQAPHETLRGVGGGTRGEFALPGAAGRYERSASRLAFFDTVERSRATLRFTLRWADGGEVAVDCKGRELTAARGVIAGRVQPFALGCEGRGGMAASLQLADEGVIGAGAGTRQERRGWLRSGAAELELLSVHRVEGSPLPLEAQIGYLIRHRGQPVGAVELNGGTPRVWRPAAGDPLHAPVTLAVVALALVWDPAL